MRKGRDPGQEIAALGVSGCFPSRAGSLRLIGVALIDEAFDGLVDNVVLQEQGCLCATKHKPLRKRLAILSDRAGHRDLNAQAFAFGRYIDRQFWA